MPPGSVLILTKVFIRVQAAYFPLYLFGKKGDACGAGACVRADDGADGHDGRLFQPQVLRDEAHEGCLSLIHI